MQEKRIIFVRYYDNQGEVWMAEVDSEDKEAWAGRINGVDMTIKKEHWNEIAPQDVPVMCDAYYEALEWRVQHSAFHQQETNAIDGVQYAIGTGVNASIHAWVMYIYPEGHIDFVGGDTIRQVFMRAQAKGIPVERITFNQWRRA